jgi:hypothetical protein
MYKCINETRAFHKKENKGKTEREMCSGDANSKEKKRIA